MIVAAVLAGACARVPATGTPVSLVVRPVDTATGRPTVTLTVTTSPTPTPTPITATQAPTDSELRTKTPAPPSATVPTATPTPTATASATERRPAAGPPASTRTPTPLPSGAGAPIGPAPDTSSHGATATFLLESRTRIFTPDQKIWFRMSVTNLTDAVLPYGFLGVTVSNGTFHTSWSGSQLAPRGTLNWRDWVSVPESGNYTLTLTMCFSPQDECHAGGAWISMSAAVPITVR